MEVIETQLDLDSERARANAVHQRALAAELRRSLALARQGGGEKYQQRHREQGKLLVRDRIDQLLDPGSAFLELSPLAAWGLYEGGAPGAGLVTGIGRVSGRECLIVANDGPVLARNMDGITLASGGSKADERSAVGRFGLGQKSVYHLCDAFIAPGQQPQWAGHVRPRLAVALGEQGVELEGGQVGLGDVDDGRPHPPVRDRLRLRLLRTEARVVLFPNDPRCDLARLDGHRLVDHALLIGVIAHLDIPR